MSRADAIRDVLPILAEATKRGETVTRESLRERFFPNMTVPPSAVGGLFGKNADKKYGIRRYGSGKAISYDLTLAGLANISSPTLPGVVETRQSNGGLFHICIYTIKHSDDLRAALKSSGKTTFTEGTHWSKANQLLKEAHDLGQQLPVVFAPAEGTRQLFGWASLDDIKLGDVTEYTFSNLKAFQRRPLKTTLKKHSDGQPVSPDYIRPYLICQTPDYLLNATVTDPLTADAVAEAIEGTRTEVKHLSSKRNRRLRDSAFAEAKGICAVCGRNFSKMLAGRGARALQVHHRKQLSAFEMPTVTTLEDLAVVCANCHCLLHLNPKQALSIEELKKMLSSEDYP